MAVSAAADISEAALPSLEALRRDDDAAWAQAYPRLREAAYPIARVAFFGAPQDHEDIVQAAIRDLWRAIVTRQAMTHVHTWPGLLTEIRTITRRRAVDLIRHRSRRPELTVCEIPESPPEGGEPEGNLSLDAGRAWAMLEQLDPPKPALIADRMNGLTDAEIAEKHGLPKGTVQSHIFRGLKKLQSLWHANA